jgi:hypothetical protein
MALMGHHRADTLEVFNTFEFASDEDKEKTSEILKKFDEYCNPKCNLTVERHIFNSRMQQPGESQLTNTSQIFV